MPVACCCLAKDDVFTHTHLSLPSKGHLGDQMRFLSPSSVEVLSVRDQLSSGGPFPPQSVCESQRETVHTACKEPRSMI